VELCNRKVSVLVAIDEGREVSIGYRSVKERPEYSKSYNKKDFILIKRFITSYRIALSRTLQNNFYDSYKLNTIYSVILNPLECRL